LTIGTYVTPSGLRMSTLPEMIEETSEAIRANTSPLANTDPDGPIGPLIGILCERVHSVGQIVQLAYDGTDPDVGEGKQLDGTCAISGTRRAAATRSSFKGTHALEVELEADSEVSVGDLFTTEEGTPIFQALQGENEDLGVSASTGGTGGTVLVEAECTEIGPIFCSANTVTVAITNIPGFVSVNNPHKATKGSNEDTDEELRARREEELHQGGSCNVDAIRADLLAYRTIEGDAPILAVKVFENQSSGWKNGLPPKSFEALVWDGIGADVENDVIAGIIWRNKPTGIEAFGTVFGTTIDGFGQAQVVRFSRAEPLDIAMEIDLDVHALEYVGNDDVAQAIVKRFSNRVNMGSSIKSDDYVATCMVLAKGVVEVTRIQIGPQGGPLNADAANFQLEKRQIGILQASDVDITTTEASE
jgi:hypothetical protein